MTRARLAAVLVLGGCAHAPPPPPPAPDAWLSLRDTPADAQVFVDERYAGPAAQPVRIRPGPRRIEVRAAGRFPAYRDVTLRPGERATLAAPLRPDPDAASGP